MFDFTVEPAMKASCVNFALYIREYLPRKWSLEACFTVGLGTSSVISLTEMIFFPLTDPYPGHKPVFVVFKLVIICLTD